MIYLRTICFAILAAAASVTALAQEITKNSIVFEGKKRTYYLYVPATVKTVPTPLLVLLHGSNRDGLSLVEKWKHLAEAEGMILLGQTPRMLRIGQSREMDPTRCMNSLKRSNQNTPSIHAAFTSLAIQAAPLLLS